MTIDLELVDALEISLTHSFYKTGPGKVSDLPQGNHWIRDSNSFSSDSKPQTLSNITQYQTGQFYEETEDIYTCVCYIWLFF